MQKVEGSSPFIRSEKAPGNGGFLLVLSEHGFPSKWTELGRVHVQAFLAGAAVLHSQPSSSLGKVVFLSVLNI